MTRAVLMLCAGVLAAAALACAPVALAPSALLAAPARLADCPAASGGPLLSRVVGLSRNFNVQAFANCNGNCTDPASGGGLSGSLYAADIKAAFDLAPLEFQQKLCTITNFFIVEPSPQRPLAWGVRKRSNPAKKYIALSTDNWNADMPLMSAQPLAAYEKLLFTGLLSSKQLAQSARNWLANVAFTANPDPLTPVQSPSPRALAMLGILAHEMGHIIWWDQALLARNCPNSPGHTPSHFYAFSWSSIGQTPRFRSFGSRNLNEAHIGPDVETLARDLRPGGIQPPDLASASNHLLSIYNGDPVFNDMSASVFATGAADEDFIETYKYWTLMNATVPLRNLTVQIPSIASPIDVITNMTRPGRMNDKQQWISSCVM